MTVGRLCRAVGLTRQGYYKARRARRRLEIDAEAVVELVKRERRLQPRLGVRKLFRLLSAPLRAMGIRLGRDRFFELLKERGLLIERVGRHGPRTTESRHGFRKYKNLLKDATLTGPHQAWVCDITYVRTEEGWLYVWLISDAWSRKIVGYAASATLEAEHGLQALSMALDQLPPGACPIHHSDRGMQYCCHAYVDCLEARGVSISMTEENHCYENGQAERVNGILKQEYGLGETFRTKAQGRQALSQGVWLFNTRRPHTSLGYRIPQEVHAAA